MNIQQVKIHWRTSPAQDEITGARFILLPETTKKLTKHVEE